MRYAIYDTASGEILAEMEAPCAYVMDSLLGGQEIFLNCPAGMTHIVGGEPVKIVPAVTDAEAIRTLRTIRDKFLAASDWTQTLDAPLTPEKKAEWAAYRQDLRDFPAVCDPVNPVWPVAPV
jgi:hypothetical protein